MAIKKAVQSDLWTVRKIVADTINAVYPHFYPKGAVDFFLKHHCEENISKDINEGLVYILTSDNTAVGTVTVCGNELARLFVDVRYQGKGYGKELLDFAENLINEKYDSVVLSASLPAKRIYLKRGYREVDFNSILTDGGDHLCYDILKKSFPR